MTPQPAAPVPQHDVAVSLEVGAEYVLTKLTKREPGPWDVLVEPYEGGHLPTSTGMEDAIRRRAAGMVPPVVVRGLNVGIKGFRGDDVLLAVEGSLSTTDA